MTVSALVSEYTVLMKRQLLYIIKVPAPNWLQSRDNSISLELLEEVALMSYDGYYSSLPSVQGRKGNAGNPSHPPILSLQNSVTNYVRETGGLATCIAKEFLSLVIAQPLTNIFF